MPQTPEERRAKQRIADAKYRTNNPEKVKARNRARDPVKRRAQAKARRDANPELARTKERVLRARNPARRRMLQKINRAKNPEPRRMKDRERQRAKRLADPEGMLAKERARRQGKEELERAQARARYHANPGRVMAHNAKHRAAIYGAPVNDLTEEQVEEIKAHYNYRCYYCKPNCWHCARKRHDLTCDHIIPPSQGGDNSYTNIVPSCRSHNSQKGNRKAPIPVQPLLLIVAPSKPHKPRKR